MAPTEGKSRKPANTAFKQQRLKAWQPILTPKTVLPTLFIVGIIFAPLGGLLLYASNTVSEIEIDYTDCADQPAEFGPMPSNLVKISFASNNGQSDSPQWRATDVAYNDIPTKRCEIKYNIPAELKGPVYMYYRLTNFYQNHRRYVKSFDAKQLQGDAVSAATLEAGNCKPLATIDGKPIYPCGLIANSMFNDTIYEPRLINATGPNTETPINFTSVGIAWPSDRQKYGPTKYNASDVVPPPNWQNRFPGGAYNETNILTVTDEAFQVWMRTAGLPDFRKLYAKTGESFEAGPYQIDIDLLFPVKVYGGRKSIVFSTVSFLGGKNPFLGVAYVAVGILCVILGSIFTAKHLLKPRKLGDHTKLSWNQNSKNSKGSGGGQ
ncbi:7238_t:CDS:2 [Paraglomus occultum]|uniref:7238_t:CDS:1 n=1 Tax=Paraglomus occultum TaxID=144539 RepID=A0A9N9AZN4_9GLOM|nr:7238_t:CDS:2 [Paraglomus occultum]